MRSLASATRLLTKCTTICNTTELLGEIGFSANPVPLSSEGIEILGLPGSLTNAHIVSGDGMLRALIFEISADHDERGTLSRVAAAISARAPQLLTLLIGLHPEHRTISIAAFSSSQQRPRVSALLVRVDEVVDSDAETICALAASRSDTDLATHVRWLETLGRESIGRRFFRDLERVVSGLGGSLTPGVEVSESSELALLYVSRLLFLSFLETKGWLDRDHAFLENQYAGCMVSGGGYHRNVLCPLFFGTLNTTPRNRARRAREFGRIPFLNGGLFNKSRMEIRTSASRFSDEAIGDVFGDLLARYRFTAREDGNSWTEAAIDPEMLGKAFECLMSARDRKTSGAFYTPQSLVRTVSHSALTYSLASESVDDRIVAEALHGSIPPPSVRDALRAKIERERILDPACGSGAFLVHVLEELSALCVRLGDIRAPHSIRRDILTRSIFGVDINPMAVWLCELRLWLSIAIDDPQHDPLKVTPLPNLDRNIRVGDSLAGNAFGTERTAGGGAGLARLRARYSRATGPRKKSLARRLDAFERKCALALLQQRIAALTHQRRELLIALRSPDLFGQRPKPSLEVGGKLTSVRNEIALARREKRTLEDGGALPFFFPTGFADTASECGFTSIVGNPPWVRTHNLAATERSLLRDKFIVYRNSAWIPGSEAAGAGRGFASQVDAAALFVERCTDLLRIGGTMSLILPAKLWRSLSGGGVRQLLLDRTAVREFHDLTSAATVFDAAVYPSVLVATRRDEHSLVSTVAAAAHRRQEVVRWRVGQNRMSFDHSRGSPWVVAPPAVRAAFERLADCGMRLSEIPLGRPLLGVKTGCNDAFIVPHDAPIERRLLRRSIRGDQVQQWIVQQTPERIVWTHDREGAIRELPPLASAWLSRWRRQLENRSDARHAHRWWALFRTEGADCTLPRVIWSDIGREARAAVLYAGDESVPLNTCYVVRCRDLEDAHTLAALLNSQLTATWLALVAEPARGGYMRHMGWTISILPLPRDWNRARGILVPFAERAAGGTPPRPEELLDAVLDSYRLNVRDVEPLLRWSG